MSRVVHTTALAGVEVHQVQVEVVARNSGRDNFSIIGLGDSAVREAKDRVESALRFLGVDLPSQILVNLAPASMKKEGTSFDLPIAVGILAALGLLPREKVAESLFVGELSLRGDVRPFVGLLAHLLGGLESGVARIFAPVIELPQSHQWQQSELIGVRTLAELCAVLKGSEPSRPLRSVSAGVQEQSPLSLDQVRGQVRAKRALEVALAGGHNLLLLGPPGCGKTMLAHCARTLLPPLQGAELLEVARVHSLSGLDVKGVLQGLPPFRSPHHTTSDAALVGSANGTLPRPGEVSVAHRGILFLDELPEFSRRSLESLRVPLEEGSVRVTRARVTYELPAAFLLIAAMNPCPCGRALSADHSCHCSPAKRERYLRRISQPLLERIDIKLTVEGQSLGDLLSSSGSHETTGVEHETTRQTIAAARERQYKRQGCSNRWLQTSAINEVATLESDAQSMVKRTAARLKFSTRQVARALRVAQTIADLEGEEKIGSVHIAEALSLVGGMRTS